MRGKIWKQGLPALCLVTMLAVDAYASIGIELNMRGYHQRQTQWCWAATSQTVRKYTSDSFRWQCKMASALIADSNNDLHCCNASSGRDPSSSRTDSCNQPFNMKRAMEWNGIYKQTFSEALSHSKIATQLQHGFPVIVTVQWDSGGGHAMVVYGQATSAMTGTETYNLWNPGQGRGAAVVTRAGLKRYRNAGTWNYSFTSKKR